MTWIRRALAIGLLLGCTPALAQGGGDEAELERLLADERRAAESMIRRGELRGALRRLDELLAERPADAEARTLKAVCLFDQGSHAAAVEEARAALAAAPSGDASPAAALRAACARNLASILCVLGRPKEALAELERVEKDLSPSTDARGAWALGRALWEAGLRERARATLDLGALVRDEVAAGDLGALARDEVAAGDDVIAAGQRSERLLARGRCQQKLGRLQAAAESFVLADEASRAAGSSEPDVLSALADLYFEADKEVAEARGRSAADLYREALRLHPAHEAAALGLFRLHRYNWQRRSRTAQEILDELLAARPGSIEGLVAGAAADLDDGQLKSARDRLSRLEAVAPGRRDVRGLRAALSWIERKDAECERILAELALEDPLDGSPEREVGRHLSELYRFAEGLPFARRAVERDPRDYEAWKELGRALANTGDEDGARAALDRARDEAAGRADAWRDNLRLVLKTMSVEQEREAHGELTFAWSPKGGEVLRAYLAPFYTAARTELAARYGFTPGPTTIEVFDRHDDFSVRSTGFQGFPALGVCFGPVVTAVSPLSELRGTQSWARTSFHEFTHVIHLGLSHNRCPRWVTEGLATWEEENRNPAWTRNLRRELVDAQANGEVIPVRDLNRAFRSARILFGYYQGGLLCRMLIERRGFPPMVRLLEAFDRGLDLDQALLEVYRSTPEDLDRELSAYVAKQTEKLRIEPRWSPALAARLRSRLARERPPATTGPEKRAEWAEGWCTVAWAAWQDGRKVDAQEALRTIQKIDPQPARAEMLRGEMALKEGRREDARAIWERAIGEAEDFRVRIALGVLAEEAGEIEAAERHYLAAEADFPGFDEEALSAELHLSRLYAKSDRKDESMQALERWLAWNAGALAGRRNVAAWHFEAGRFEAAARFLAEANEVDPFLRQLHRAWGDALRAAGKHADALREYEVGPAVPPELDADAPGAMDDEERAEWLGLQAACLQALGKNAEAAERAKKALELDSDCAIAREALEKAR